MSIQDQDPMMRGSGNAIIVKGCTKADGGPGCCRNCDGGWPGTMITTEAMTSAVRSGRIDPSKLGCQPLYDRAIEGLRRVKAMTQTEGAILSHGEDGSGP